MRISLIDVDNKYRDLKKNAKTIPNLALMKLSAHHKAKGDIVGLNLNDPDITYISCVFTWNQDKVYKEASKVNPPKIVICGGSGIDINCRLPENIECLKPDYDLYSSEYSQGFTTRGCGRKCSFCIVPEKEGKIHTAQHPREFHDDRFDTCMIMDNNLFMAPQEWQDSVFNWFIENKIKMLSPQGWDIRILNEKRAKALRKITHAGMVHFAWDNIKDESAVLKGINLLAETGFDLRREISVYVLSGYNPDFGKDTFEQDVYRCNKLRSLGVQAYVMRYQTRAKTRTVIRGRRLNALARWAASPEIYWKTPFEKYDRKEKRADA